MDLKHKMKIFLNDPSFKRQNLQTISPQIPKQNIFRSMFPLKLEMQRFRHLQQARVNTNQDLLLDKNTQKSILKLQQALKIFHQKDMEYFYDKQRIQNKKEAFFGKFKMDYVEDQMNKNLKSLQKLVNRHEELHEFITSQKKIVQKSLIMTQIKKALKIQNQLLKNENEKLKQQQKRLDNYIANIMK